MLVVNLCVFRHLPEMWTFNQWLIIWELDYQNCGTCMMRSWEIWSQIFGVFFSSDGPSQYRPPQIVPMIKVWGLIYMSDPYINQLKFAAVVNDFTNVLEIKTTKICREGCWEDAYAKILFCATRPFTIILIVQSPYSMPQSLSCAYLRQLLFLFWVIT